MRKTKHAIEENPIANAAGQRHLDGSPTFNSNHMFVAYYIPVDLID
jgi:hypothetical protein